MKIRNGFVSNSSSASFVIKWFIDGDGPQLTDNPIYDAIKYVFDYSDDSLREEIERYTTIDKKRGIFTTHKWISMMNSHSDFGEAMAQFWLALSLRPELGVTVLHSSIENDY